jgi:hypothetical protein
MSVKFKPKSSKRHVHNWLRYREKLVITPEVIAVMECAKKNGFSCYVSFDADKVARLLIQKVK